MYGVPKYVYQNTEYGNKISTVNKGFSQNYVYLESNPFK